MFGCGAVQFELRTLIAVCLSNPYLQPSPAAVVHVAFTMLLSVSLPTPAPPAHGTLQSHLLVPSVNSTTVLPAPPPDTTVTRTETARTKYENAKRMWP